MQNTSVVENNAHSASGSLLGYLFQIERLLFWLSLSDVELVSLETEDDIVADLQGKSATKILEQAKHSTTKKIPYSDSSVDLWKTVSIWVDQVTSNEINPEKLWFYIVANKKLPSGRLIKQIVTSRTDENKFKQNVDKLLKIGGSASKTIKPFADKVIACPREKLEAILTNLNIYDDEPAQNLLQLKQFIRKNLGISNRLPFDSIYQSLVGYVIEIIVQSWQNSGKLSIKREELLHKTSELISAYQNKSFIERAIDSLPLSKAEIETNKGKLFVAQLRSINCDEDEIIQAIAEFMRSTTEKERYANEGDILESDFIQYYSQLKDHWQTIFKPKSRIANGSRPADTGYEIFYDTIKFRGKLCDQEPTQSYTFRGAYHHLADIPEIGWIPSWEKDFKVTIPKIK